MITRPGSVLKCIKGFVTMCKIAGSDSVVDAIEVQQGEVWLVEFRSPNSDVFWLTRGEYHFTCKLDSIKKYFTEVSSAGLSSERLTARMKDGAVGWRIGDSVIRADAKIDGTATSVQILAAAQKLAEYEDTGLSPAEFNALCELIGEIRVESGFDTLEELRDFVKGG